MSIYRPCDIRGDGVRELSPAMYRAWGAWLGRRLPRAAKFVAGGDVRDSTPAFLAAFMEGLCQNGLDVVNLGILPTPMVYYAKRRLQAEGCAVVTASRKAASLNGLKWMLGDGPPSPGDVADMKNALGNAGNEVSAAQTRPRTLDVSFDYVACLQETFVDSLTAQQHVVVDSMGGAWAGRARRYLQAIFPQCLFSSVHDSADGRFGGREPDCSRSEALRELSEAVYRERAHVGIAFDGDGDRLALVDDQGVALNPEETAWTLLQCFGEELRGQAFVHDMRLSDRLVEAAERQGAHPVAARGGHGFLCSRMRECGAAFGMETNGHYFHRALEGHDDALYTACRLIAFLARSDQRLSDLRQACPSVYMTPELRVSVPWAAQAEIMAAVCSAWQGFPQQTLDGVRIEIPGGWALVRSSHSEPALAFRFEGLDWHALEDIVEKFCRYLPDPLGKEVWASYASALGKE